MTVVTLMKTMIWHVWHDQGSETVRRKLRDVDEARGMIQEVGSRGKVTSSLISLSCIQYVTSYTAYFRHRCYKNVICRCLHITNAS